MYKKISVIFISLSAFCSAFAQEEINLNFTGEIYEQACDFNHFPVEEKCAVLEKQFDPLKNKIANEQISSEMIQDLQQNVPEVHSTFYAASLNSVNANQALNIEIHYK